MNRLIIKGDALRLSLSKQGPAGIGTPGAAGASSYLYVAYAADDEGADFSLTPDLSRPYRAEKISATAIATPDAEDFAGLWVRFIGQDGNDGEDATLAPMAAGTMKGRAVGSGTGLPADLTPAEARTVLGISEAAEGVVNQSTVALMRTALGAYGSGDSPSFNTVTAGTIVQPSGPIIIGLSGGSSYGVLKAGSAGFYVEANTANSLHVTNTKLSVRAVSFIGFGSNAPDDALDTAFSRSAAGLIQINNGTAGQYRDLSLRTLTASGSIVFPAYTVAAANALTGVQTNAVITISNEVGGRCLAQYDGTNWKRQTDLAIISA